MLPRSFQERIKVFYYNRKIDECVFSFHNGVYKTSNETWNVKTYSPLYFIIKDLNRYEKFYKVSTNDVILDAGANEGILSLIYANKVGPMGLIYSFEPDSKNRTLFSRNVSLNDDIRNIHLSKKGLWEHTGKLNFYESGTVSSSILYEGPNAVKSSIDVISIDDFVLELNIKKLDFIKMDIEGAEVEAIRGAKDTIKSLKPNFAIASYHLVNNEYTYKSLELIFREFDYPFKTIFFEDGEIITYAGSMVLQHV